MTATPFSYFCVPATLPVSVALRSVTVTTTPVMSAADVVSNGLLV